MSSITDRLEKDVAAWRPDPEDKLVGTVVEVDERVSDYGPYPLLIVETEDGDEVAVHAFHTVLKNELARKRPQPGDTIGIVYRGKDEDRGYERYRVVLDRVQATAGIDWDAHQVSSEAEIFAAGDTEPKPPPPTDADEPAADVPFDTAV